MGKSKKTKEELIEQEEQYIQYLKKKLNSENFKANVSLEKFKIEKKKYDKAKLKLKFLKEN